jgi:hypothetical protein
MGGNPLICLVFRVWESTHCVIGFVVSFFKRLIFIVF